MGFLANTFNKSLFTVDSYKSAIGDEKNNGYAVFKIYPDNKRSGSKDFDYGVVGIIQNPLKFDITAEWEHMGGITGLLPSWAQKGQALLNTGANIGGFADMGSVYASRKIYKKSGYLNISADLKIVNWENKGSPLLSAIYISNLLLPDSEIGEQKLFELKKMIESLAKKGVLLAQRSYEAGKDAIINGAGTVDKVTGNSNVLPDLHLKEPVEGVFNLMEETVGYSVEKGTGYADKFLKSSFGQNLVKNTIAELEDYALLRSSPSTVTVEIGNFFKQRDMVLTDASFEFSKEMTKTGPLYVDVHLSLSSRMILGDLTSLGLGENMQSSTGNSSRVVVTY